VRVSPRGSSIRVAGRNDLWRDTAELSVTAGDTLMLELSRAGYITQRLPFTGSRLAVTLLADSVQAAFDANVPAEVFLGAAGRETRLGATPLAARLPTGTHRVLFRSAGQPDWESTQRMPQAGQRYTVSKMDYVTLGSLIVSVAGAWANVSVDGSAARETPARFDSLSVGRHIVVLAREGYASVVDTVLVQPGQPTRRQYTLRR
jgi:hypothetical protein